MFWAITLHKQFVKSFLEGEKKVEVRTRVPKALRSGDWIYVIQENTGGKVVMRMRVLGVLKMSPQVLWERRWKEIQVNYLAYSDYFKGRQTAYGILIDIIEPIGMEVYRDELGLTSSPQWFALVTKLGRLACKHVDCSLKVGKEKIEDV